MLVALHVTYCHGSMATHYLLPHLTHVEIGALHALVSAEEEELLNEILISNATPFTTSGYNTPMHERWWERLILYMGEPEVCCWSTDPALRHVGCSAVVIDPARVM